MHPKKIHEADHTQHDDNHNNMNIQDQRNADTEQPETPKEQARQREAPKEQQHDAVNAVKSAEDVKTSNVRLCSYRRREPFRGYMG